MSQSQTAAQNGRAGPGLELPSGGGAIRGIGEKFTFNAANGTASISVPVPALSARGAMTPALELSYDSGFGNGAFGSGWRLNVPTISRKTDKGLPRYLDEDESDTFVFLSAEDLVPLEAKVVERNDGYTVRRYLPRVEAAFARIEWWKHRENGCHWRVISSDNVTHLLGLTDDGQIADPKDPTKIFQWLLQASFDDKGNAAIYGYRPEDRMGCGTSRLSESHRADSGTFSNRHLAFIAYGNRSAFYPETGSDYLPSILAALQSAQPHDAADWHFRILLDYGDHPDATHDKFSSRDWLARKDAFSSYRSGFEIRNYRLCRRILFLNRISIETDGAETGYTGLTHALDLGYAESDILTKLAAVRQVHFRRPGDGETASDGNYCRAEWPALEFEYSAALDPTFRVVPAAEAANVPDGVGGAHFEWSDIDGEGLQGILARTPGIWSFAANRWIQPWPADREDDFQIGGAFTSLLPLRSRPNTGDDVARARLMDIDANGLVNVVELGSGDASLYRRSTDYSWDAPSIISRPPAFNVNDPNLRFIDLDGDGRAELLISEADCFLWQESLGAEGFGAVHRVAKLLDERQGPRCVFEEATQTIFLADMSGDGLTDIVRIRNADVCFWPNLGYGRFGARVMMDASPVFDRPDQFDPGRIRLIDVDGSGIVDILYLSRTGAGYWANLAGNGWGARHEIPFSIAHSVATVSSADFYGRGTGCLIWSSAGPADRGSQLRVVDLTGGVKPHLLTVIRNNIGAETRLSYRSSTQFYLEDLIRNRPWLTRLPFPVHLVSVVEILDQVSGNRFSSHYSYHHGFYDGIEREFRGFGLVEQRDTERIAALQNGPGSDDKDDEQSSYVPPTLTKTWYHHGAWRRDQSLVAAFRSEYWTGDSVAPLLDDTIIPPELSVDEEREACRALRGRVLRREVYAEDSRFSPGGNRPYEVLEQNFTVKVVQRKGSRQHATFYVHPRESVQMQYERADSPDPRVKHDCTIKVDEFGNVEQAVAIAYRRRAPDKTLSKDERRQQDLTRLTFSVRSFTNQIEAEGGWRTPLPAETQVYELSGESWSTAKWEVKQSQKQQQPANNGEEPIDFDEIAGRLANWPAIPEIIFNSEPDLTKFQRRLIEHTVVRYRQDDLKDLLPVGSLQVNALEGETLKLVITGDLLPLYADRASEEQLLQILRDPALGYHEPGGDARFWTSSGRRYYSADATGRPQDATDELTFARKHFYQPHKFEDTFGHTTRTTYDDTSLRIVEIVDPVGDTTRAEYNYRVLQPTLLIDCNGNCTAAAFDTRGLVVATAVLGKQKPLGEFGDTLVGVKLDLALTDLQAFEQNPVAQAPALLGKATTRVVYDVLRFLPPQGGTPARPVFAATLARELHNKNEPNEDYKPEDHIQCKFSYSDGFGREIQQKVRTTSGPLQATDAAIASPRWIGSGWTIFNNKGAPVRQYEPFFTATHEFEFRRLEGVSPILFYDPVGRAVATLRPDHSWEKVVFDPWQVTAWDADDTVLIDPLTDPDVGEFFRRLPASQWPLIDGASPTWHKIRVPLPGNKPSQALLDLFPGDDSKAIWRRTEEMAAAGKTEGHANTPMRKHFDTLGHEFLAVTHNKFKNHRTGDEAEQFAATRTVFDIKGNRLEVFDALGRSVMRWKHDLLGAPIFEASMDSGRRWMVPDAAFEPARRWDERGHAFRHLYDAARRPLEHWVVKPALQHEAVGAPQESCYEKIVYGEKSADAAANNLGGHIWEHYDPAGRVTNRRYDAKGNLLISARQFNTTYKDTPDWSKEAELESEQFVTVTEFDALNRPIAITTPDTNGDRGGSETLPRYNISGQLAAITIIADKQRTLRSTIREPHYIVRDINYNAKGQRRMIQFGNDASGEGLRTSLSYDPRTFRLLNLTTVNKGGVTAYQDLDYAYDPVGNITAINDSAQQTFYFNNQVVTPSADYTYDAVYRLLAASGREHKGQNLAPNAWDFHRVGTFNASCELSRFTNPGDGAAMRNYTQRYLYDLVGNIEEMIHQAAEGSWRRTYAYELIQGSRDKRSNRLISTTVGGATSRYDYNSHGSMIAMPHLPAMETDFRDQLSMTQRQDVKCDKDRPASRGERTYYVYDAAGERVRKVTERNGRRLSERRYLGAAETYREYDNAGDAINFERQTVHVSDGNHRFAIVESRIKGDDKTQQQIIRCQFPNHLDSATLEVEFDPAAKIISYEEFHPYGTTAYQARGSKIVPAAKRYRFVGRERDEESGLNYHSARYLATWLGRWISADPSGLKDGPNRFAYARLNPIAFSDLTGRASWGQVAGFATVVVVGAAVTAFTGGLGAGLVLAAVAGGAAGGVAGTAVEAAFEGRRTTAGELALSGVVGGASAFLGIGLARGAGALTKFIAGTAPARTAAAFVASSSIGRTVGAALEAVGSSAPVRIAGRVVQTVEKGVEKGLEKAEFLGKVLRRELLGTKPIEWLTPGTLPAAEELALKRTLEHIEAGTKPTGKLAKKWGTTFENRDLDLGLRTGSDSPFLEFRVAPPAGATNAGARRVVMNKETKELYYTWTHYGDSLTERGPAFVRIR